MPPCGWMALLYLHINPEQHVNNLKSRPLQQNAKKKQEAQMLETVDWTAESTTQTRNMEHLWRLKGMIETLPNSLHILMAGSVLLNYSNNSGPLNRYLKHDRV